MSRKRYTPEQVINIGVERTDPRELSAVLSGAVVIPVRAFFDLRESLGFSIAWKYDSRCKLVKEASLHDATSFE